MRAKEWASKLAESDKGSYYNQEKWLKDDKAPEKPIETTAELSFSSLFASGASFLGREAAKWETKAREVLRHIKIGRSTVFKVYRSGKAASRKICCRLFQESVELLKNVSSKSWLGSTWLVRCENYPLQITNDVFLTTERIKQSRAFEINCSWHLLSGFVFKFSCCVTIVVPSLVCINIDRFGVIIWYHLVTGNTPPKIFFHCFLKMKIRASWGYILNSKSAACEPIWLKFGQLIVR